MGWAVIGTGLLAIAFVAEKAAIRRIDAQRDSAANEAFLQRFEPSLRNDPILPAALAFVASVSGSAFLGLLLALLALWVRATEPGPLEVTTRGLRSRRPIFGPGREAGLAWGEVKSVVAEHFDGNEESPEHWTVRIFGPRGRA
ncbi:MAG: hypothetical protein GC160_23310 [Acidobacteria bacterium]|nr:hypothetical protein [Acidobacteriota bacterium]